MKGLNIGMKIGLAFGVMLIFMSFITYEGHDGLSDLNLGFTEYRELSNDANLAGRLQANILIASVNSIKFENDGNEQNLARYNERKQKILQFLDDAQQEIEKPERAELIDTVDAALQKYLNGFAQIVQFKREQDRILAEIMVPKAVAIEKALTSIMKSAFEDGDASAAYRTGDALRNLLLARLYAQKFLATNSQQDADLVETEFDQAGKQLAILDDELQNPQRRALLKNAGNEIEQYKDGFREMVQVVNKRKEVAQTAIEKAGPVIDSSIEKVKLSVIADQIELGKKLKAHNEDVSTTIMSVSGIVIFIGILLAFIITRLIATPLKRAARFAQAVARGDFSEELVVKGSDEVAQVGQALLAIPQSISRATTEFDELVSAVERGEFSKKADENEFEGEFASLMRGGNTMLERFSNFLDQLPTPIVIMSPGLKVRHLNKKAMTISNASISDYGTTNCAALLKSDDCNTEKCACSKAMQSRHTVESETTARPGNLSLDVSYAGVPLVDRNGQIAGVMEVITDLTEIKAAQRKMSETAQIATSIAERLASASEELSAQVEQVNSGTLTQRQRMDETTTAMEEMNATATEVARNASSAARGLEASRQQANEGADVVRQTVVSIEGVNAKASELKSTMMTLGEKAEGIGQVMNVISDIADQTNLLALNAAIEAARAGDAGRGFAVVADEVRKLAEKTMEATREVGNSIGAIQEAARANIATTEEASDASAKTADLAKQSGEVFATIVDMTEENAGQVQEIATAAEEQSAASEQVVGAAIEVNTIVNDTVAGMASAEQAVREVAAMSSELTKIMNELR